MKNAYQWGLGLFLGIYHLALFVALPLYFVFFGVPSATIILSTIILFFLTGLSITAGYHRYYSHKSFKTNKIIEGFLLFFGTMSLQGSALRWSFEHRLHHRYVDGENDPYSIKRGFWYSHFLWLFDNPRPIEEKWVPDLMQNKLVMFQYKYYGILSLAVNALAIVSFGLLFHSFLASFIFIGLLRIFLLHHFTWFINSLAHTWGSRTFSKEHTAVDNYLISLVTFGEGYHNYHHTFCADYRNGIKWYNFDPTKWLIWTLSKLGLAKQLTKVEPFRRKKKQILYDKALLLETVKGLLDTNRKKMEETVSLLSTQLIDSLSKMNQLSSLYKKAKKSARTKEGRGSSEKISQIKEEISGAKKELNAQWKKWSLLTKEILSGSKKKWQTQ